MTDWQDLLAERVRELEARASPDPLSAEKALALLRVIRGYETRVSGNPGGRPKVLGDVQELARQKSPEAINTLSNIMNDDKAQPLMLAEVGWDYGG